MSIGVEVRPEIQLIVRGRYFDSFGQIPGLEAGLKPQFVFLTT
jgi:hypothetical protein